MRLSELTSRGSEVEVTGFSIDNRKVEPGHVFGAFQGARHNGEDFIADAVERGAVAVVCRDGIDTGTAQRIASDNPRKAFAQIAVFTFCSRFSTETLIGSRNEEG